MPYKSLRYFRNTIILKSAALLTEISNKTGILNNFKTRNRNRFVSLYHQNVEGALNNGHFTRWYIPYTFFAAPQELKKHLVFDEKGVPLARYDTKPKHHNPLIACFCGLVCYNYYLDTGKEEHFADFLKQAIFLNHYGLENASGFWLPYQTNNSKFGLKAPWHAGITQALAMSVFIRAYMETGEENYRQRVNQLCSTLFLPVESGGFLRSFSGDLIWMEEYPSLTPSSVLNGYVFCLIGIFEYYLTLENSQFMEVRLQELLRSLFYSLHNYIFGRFTKYGLDRMVFSNIEYQGLYVFLFFHLYVLSGSPAFMSLTSYYNENTNWSDFFSFYQINADETRAKYLLAKKWA